MDKGYGVEIFDGGNCRFLLSLPEVKAAKGFLQCDSENYSFIEFWTDDMSVINLAFETIKKTILTN